MITRLLLIATLALTPILSAAETTPEDMLRQGLFEEEANRDFDKATERYRAVVAAHDRQRSLAATATFRLGEIARKKNDKEAAASAFRIVAERFPEQADLARMSRENLAALGMAPAITPTAETPAAPQVIDPEEMEIARLKDIARNSPDLLDGPDGIGWRPMHHAAKNGWTKVISYLLENKADPSARTSNESFTPLHLATIYGHLESVKVLLAANGNLDLYFSLGNPEIVLPPMDRRVGRPNGNWSALDLAILYDRREIARVLIKSGADINRVGPGYLGVSSLTPLLLAIDLQRNELAINLIEAGVPAGGAQRGPTFSPLECAVMNNPQMVVPLLKAGADPKAVNAKGQTALHLATTPEIVELLVSKGADPNAKAKDGATPLDLTATSKERIPKATFEALLKHGATTTDAIALLKRASSTMLPIVRERVVYPKEHRPDAILLSLDGSYKLGSSQLTIGPDLKTLEVRPAVGSPPPSLAEALCEVFESENYPQSIKILRRNAAGRFEGVREWVVPERGDMPKDWPALQWGDIVEILTRFGGTTDESSVAVGALHEQIAARTLTISLGEFSFQQQISGKERYWADGEFHPEKVFLEIEDLLDVSRFTVRRKGVEEPIKVDFTKQSFARFRFIDGDKVEMSFDTQELNRRFGRRDSSNLRWFSDKDDLMSFGGERSVVDVLTNYRVILPNNADVTKIAVLRRAENWQVERVNVVAWLDSLPIREKWSQEVMLASVPKIQPGDIVLLFPTSDEKVMEKVKDARAKLKEAGEIAGGMRPGRPPIAPIPQPQPGVAPSSQPRTRVVPPPQPGQ